MKKKEVYILLSNVKTNIGRLIVLRGKLNFLSKKEGAVYSHVSISLDKNFENMQSFSRKEMHNPFNAGLVKESIKEGHFKKNREKGNIAILKIEVPEEKYLKLAQSIEENWKNKNKFNYNYLGVIVMLFFGIGVKRKNRFFCSEYVSTLLKEAEILNSTYKECHHIRPFDLYDVYKPQIIYEGNIKEYIA